MAKLAILAAVLALSMALATATVTITTVEVGKSSTPSKQCSRQVQGQRLSACQKFLMSGCECGCQDCQCSSRTGLMMMRGDTCRSQLTQCCDQLKSMDDQCQCQGIKSIVQKMQQQEEQMFEGEDEMEEMVKMAKKLPVVCGFTRKSCDNIRAVWF